MDPLYWSIGLLLLGLVLIALELFVPSGGMLGVLAGLAVIGSIVMAFSDGVRSGAIMLLATALSIPMVIYLGVRWWPHSPLGRLILIKRKTDEELLPPDNPRELIGKLGRAKSKMLPSGAVLIEGQIYDAVSQGTPIESGQTIKVVGVRNNRIVVRQTEEAEPPQAFTAAPSESADDLLSQPIDALGLDPLDDPLA